MRLIGAIMGTFRSRSMYVEVIFFHFVESSFSWTFQRTFIHIRGLILHCQMRRGFLRGTTLLITVPLLSCQTNIFRFPCAQLFSKKVALLTISTLAIYTTKRRSTSGVKGIAHLAAGLSHLNRHHFPHCTLFVCE